MTIQVWNHLFHDFQSFAVIIPEAREAINDIGVFLKKNLK